MKSVSKNLNHADRCALPALQYHPDRNPDQDTTAKFQAIQAANEILTDPQQRAKYDAHRIRAGLLHNYNGAPPPPPRTNAAARAATSNFPPPPKPPPFNPKPKFSSPKTGPQKYSTFTATPEAKTGTWRTKDANDAKTKTNDFKAWEHMRHGQGPIPKVRKEPPTPEATFGPDIRPPANDRDPNGSLPRRNTARRTDWEAMPDAGMSGTQRTGTFRVPPSKPNGYFPATPDAGDEPQARSAYFNVQQGERSTSSRGKTNMGPPPPPRAPTAKKPDPVQAFKASMVNSESAKRHPPYPTVHGEKTDVKNPGLHRSSTNTTPRDSNPRSGFYDSDTANTNGFHGRAASTGSSRRYPEFARTGFESLSTTSSESSSDEEMDMSHEGASRSTKSDFLRPTPNTKPARPGMGSGAPQRSFFNPYVKAEDAEDEPMAPHSAQGEAAYNGYRRHSHHDIRSSGPDYPRSEGFGEHRRRHEAEVGPQPSTSAPTGSAETTKPSPMSRPRSFDERYRSPPPDTATKSTSGTRPDNAPMYDSNISPTPSPLQSQVFHPSSSISSEQWSDQWCSFPSKEPQKTGAKAPPYWAIPSTLPAHRNPYLCCKNTPDPSSHNDIKFEIKTDAYADYKPFHSFRWGVGDLPKPFFAKPPLNSQNSDEIDVKFSPAGEPPQFKAGGESSTSPTKGTPGNPISLDDLEEDDFPKSPLSANPSDATSESKIPPPPQGPACFFPNDWHHRYRAASRSRSRNPSQKRTGTSRTGSMSSGRRQVPGRNANLHPTLDEDGDEVPQWHNPATESASSSRVGSEGSAMDIDPVLTPASAGDPQQPAHKEEPPSAPLDTSQRPTQQGPTLPPRTAAPAPASDEPTNLNMGNLRNTKPLAAGAGGLSDVGDLRSTLPFESRPAPTKPNFEKVTQVSQMPKPPKAPTPPSKLNRTTWDLFIREMNRYMSNWSNYNNVMLSHFHARQEVQSQMSPGWMEAQGDGDYNAYLESVAEDMKVHKFWEVACDNHLANMKTLGQVRQAMKAEISKASMAN